jgi:hypothetical protein
MGIMPFYLVFLHSIPETMILIFLGLLFIGIKPSLNRVLLVAVLTSLASYFIRALPLPPGINVFLQLPILIGLLAYIGRLPLVYSTVASFLGLILIGVAETIYSIIAAAITGITVQEALANPLWRALYPLPDYLILALIIIILIRKDIVVFKIREVFEKEKSVGFDEKQHK